MTVAQTTRRGLSNEGGFFSPYYLFDLMVRQHRDELDLDGRDRERKKLPRAYRRALARLEDGAPVGRLWAGWLGELFEALGIRTQTLDGGYPTRRHGRVPVSHAVLGPEGQAIAYLDVHPLGFDLDHGRYEATSADDADVTREPIARAFELALDAGETRWGLLTNGHELRLYRKGGTVSRQFLRVRFSDLFDLDLEDEWTAFWGLFRSSSFVPGSDGKSLLDRVLDESQRHASRVAEDLRENVVDAVEALIQGVIDERSNAHLWGGGPPDRAALERLFEETLNYLYRLLFVLYAESRDVLPIGSSKTFRETYSVEHLRDLADRDLPGEDAHKTYYAETLRTLFRLLRKGFKSTEFEIAPLGGHGPEDADWESVRERGEPHLTGLFDARRTRWLDSAVVPDVALRTVIRELSLSRPRRRRDRRERYSYADLGVDQLGSIYEGLLAYEPAVLTEETVLAKVSGEERLVSRGQAEANHLPLVEEGSRPPGTFVLRLWGGRRKGSGSYYTPQEITQFLTKEALEPAVDAILARCSAAGVAALARAQAEADRTGGLVLPDQSTHIAEEILDLKVCDPAMGSGAFLVQACRYLAEAYGRALVAEGRDASGRMEAEDLGRYKRLVAERCLYGVDLNPLAVELAKVSLWLETLARGQPLSFLDARLRCGNSLVGAPLRGRTGGFSTTHLSSIPQEALALVVEEANGAQVTSARALRRRNGRYLDRLEEMRKRGEKELFGLDDGALRSTLEAYTSSRAGLETDAGVSADPFTARERQETAFRTIYDASESPVKRLRQICDVWCAAWFWPEETGGTAFATEEYRIAASAILAGRVPTDEWFALAAAAAVEQRFFHWELEFPEVFLRERGGFDAILGNPPWNTLESDALETAADFDPMLVGLRGDARETRMRELLTDASTGTVIVQRMRRVAQYARFCSRGASYSDVITGKVTTFAPMTALGWELVRAGGAVALVLKDAFHLTDSFGMIRAMIFGSGRIEVLAAADNERRIFDADHKMRFDLVVARRGPKDPTVGISVHRFRDAREIVGHARDTIAIPLDLLRGEDGQPTEAIPELQDRDWPTILEACRGASEGTLAVRWSTEANSSTDKVLWTREGRPTDSPGPVLALVGPFDALGYEPMAWLRAGADSMPAWRKLDWGKWRVAVRDRANQKDERVLIGAVVPSHVATCDFLRVCREPEDNPRAVLLVAALGNSLVLDYLARPFVGMHMSSGILNRLPWAVRVEDPVAHEIIAAAARLTCTRPEFAALGKQLGVDEGGSTLDAAARARIRTRIDALVGVLYRLTLAEFMRVLASFRLLDQDQPALLGEPRSTVTRDSVLAAYAEQQRLAPPTDIVALFASVGIDIASLTGEIRDLRARLDAAARLGAVAYIPSRRSSGGNAGEAGEAVDR